jgi:hypothetical protein
MTKIINMGVSPHSINSTPYGQHLSKTFFNVCKDRTVLEIAPFNGWHSGLIMENEPTKLTLVEPNPSCTAGLQSTFPDADVYCDDIFNFYQRDYPVDVVVCCGLLYHLHSPVHLLELIVNRSRPKVIIIDNVEDIIPGEMSGRYGYEFPNQPGNRFSTFKHIAKLNCSLPYHTMSMAMRDMSYQEYQMDSDLKRFDVTSKFGFMVMYRRTYDY